VIRRPQLVSVVVPSFNPGRHLEAQLEAIAEQDYDETIEVIVADNGSRDGSFPRASDWILNKLAFRVIDASSRRGPGAARNAGVRAARGDFLAFCDADDVVSSGWLRELVNTASTADVVGGRFEAGRLNSDVVSRAYQLADPSKPFLDFLPGASGANLGVWRDVFESLDGFDEASRTGEDIDLVWRAQLRGYRYQPSAALVHKRFPVDLRDAARRFFAYGRGDARLYRRYAAAGMPRRGRQETVNLWRHLATGSRGAPESAPRIRWTIVLALSCGRLVGSARHRVLYT
jgi:glycosyltransferase involved in cell wall biosynthesis